MTGKFIHYLPWLLACALGSACSRDHTQELVAQNTLLPGGDALITTYDVCALALMPPAPGNPDSIDLSIARYQQAARDAESPVLWLERLGWEFVRKARTSRDSGYLKLAEQTALCMQSKVPGNAESQLLLGHVLHNLHRFQDAEHLARKLVSQRGAWFDHALLGDVLVERGQLAEAIAAYQAVADQRPGPQAYTRVSRIRWIKGDVTGAMEMMWRAVQTTSKRTPEAAAWAQVQLAQMLTHSGQTKAADTLLSEALSQVPGYPPALHARAWVLMAQQLWDEAIPLLEQAVLKDALPEYRWTLYEALIATGKREGAERQRSALQASGIVEDRRTYALFLATTGNEAELALNLARQELKEREDIYTLDALAWALYAAGRHTEALDYSRRALAEGTRDARLLLHGGVIAAGALQHEQALDLLNRARALQHMLLPSERRWLTEEFAAI